MSRDYADGDVIFDTQWRALKEAINGNGFLDTTITSVTPNAGTFMLNISTTGPNNCYRNKALVTIVAGTVTFTAAVTDSKWGAIWIPASGVPYMKMGAEAPRPIMPEPNSWDDVLLACVLITPGMTEIKATDIIMMRFVTPVREHMQDTTNPHSVSHAQTTGQTANDHHNKSHSHDGADGSGTVAHNDTTGKQGGSGTEMYHLPLEDYNRNTVSGTILKTERIKFAKDQVRETVTSTSWSLIGASMVIAADLDTIYPNIPGCTKKYRFGAIMGGSGGSSVQCRVKVGGVVKDTLGPAGATATTIHGTPFTLTTGSYISFFAEALVNTGSNYVYDWWIDIIWEVN
ncbi:MAG: hypothetical protein DRP09_13495 [Candidatus Thorarchaeota archaeon]|nr:MAG: hypothetical protein DRP09_13495 [Candidatus Thorarchaeota archaeon]